MHALTLTARINVVTTAVLLATTAGAQVVSTPPATPSSAPPAAAGAPAAPPAVPDVPFAERTITLQNGVIGRAVTVASATPRLYEDIVQKRPMPPVTLHAKLFVPRGAGKSPAVIVAPGSGGVNPSLLVHAAALVDSGIAVLLLDPFGGRGIKDTIAAQTQLSWAASTWDVLASVRALEAQPDIDATRIGAMGCSRGGIAVLNAAVRPVAEATFGPGRSLRAVLAGWPWCGFQFVDPQTAPTAVRFVVGDVDNWVSPNQCQAYFSAMRPLNAAASFRLVRGASHGFGYATPLREIPQAIHALNGPIVYFDSRGVAQNGWTGEPMPDADDIALGKLGEPILGRGVRAGTQGEQMQDFIRDFVRFFTGQLKP